MGLFLLAEGGGPNLEFMIWIVVGFIWVVTQIIEGLKRGKEDPDDSESSEETGVGSGLKELQSLLKNGPPSREGESQSPLQNNSRPPKDLSAERSPTAGIPDLGAESERTPLPAEREETQADLEIAGLDPLKSIEEIKSPSSSAIEMSEMKQMTGKSLSGISMPKMIRFKQMRLLSRTLGLQQNSKPDSKSVQLDLKGRQKLERALRDHILFTPPVSLGERHHKSLFD